MLQYEKELELTSINCCKNREFNFLDLLQKTHSKSSCMMGIDEAGRGPVLGPMVYASALAPVELHDKLKSIGFADSKTLTEEQREKLLTATLQQSDWIAGSVHVISPVYISEKMLDRCKTSLNTISHDAAIGLIQTALDADVNLKEVYVDTVGKAEHYQAKLQALFPMLKITVESKADDTYPIVSAASIFAKVSRDRLLRMWPSKERGSVDDDVPLGSGYPGDPVTKKYLEKCLHPVFGFPSLVRASWSTATNLMEKSGVRITWEDDDDAEKAAEAKRMAKKREHAKGTVKLSNFFNSEVSTTVDCKQTAKRRNYFNKCQMVHVDHIR